jgi:hypothetical protein
VRPVAGSTASRAAVAAMAAWPVRFHPRVSAAEMAVAAALPNRELRQTAFFLLSFYPWELRPNQRSMNWTFFQFDRRLCAGVGAHVRATRRDINMIVHVVFVGGFRARIFGGGCDANGDWYWYVDLHRRLRGFGIKLWARRRAVGGEVCGEDFLVERRRRFLLAASRNLSPFIRVLGIARRASSLLDVLFYHRDDGVVGQPPLARTVVVQYVTETQPALLHSTPPKIACNVWRKDRWRFP